MKSIHDLKENEVIHCRTKEEWDKVCDMMERRGVPYLEKCCSGEGLIDCRGLLGCASLAYYQRNDYTIHPASEFLNPFPQVNRLDEVAVLLAGREQYDKDLQEWKKEYVKKLIEL